MCARVRDRKRNSYSYKRARVQHGSTRSTDRLSCKSHTARRVALEPRGVVTYRLGLVLNAHGDAGGPRVVHGGADAALHVGSEALPELRRLEEGAGEAVHPALEGAAEHQDGGLAHQFHQRPRVPRHEHRRVRLQHGAAHLRVRAHHRR
jgi:hypothetical protein